MRKSKIVTLLPLVLTVLLLPVRVLSQTSTGEANGTVSDQSGAFVAEADVTLVNQATKIAMKARSNPSGSFRFINVPPGSYVLRAEKAGFKTAQTAPFDIGVSQTVTQNVALAIGATTEVVQVVAENTLVDRTSTELGTVIDHRPVNELPLNGRNFTQLLTLTPGATPVSTSQNNNINGGEGNYGIPNSGFSDASFQGQNNRSKLYFFDGIINTNVRGPTYIVLPDLDLIQEFKVVSHDPKAEFGGVAGGVTNIVSKPGTNRFHGSAFEYLRNNFFDARDSIKDAKNRGPAGYHQNQFGATFSGPIIRNKTFFSGGYDGWRYSRPTQNLRYVPTASELNGDFSGPIAGATAQPIYNPYTGVAASRTRFQCDAQGNPLHADPITHIQPKGVNCNKIPNYTDGTGLINPAMQSFLKAYLATPNFTGDPAHNFIQTRATTNNTNSYQIRVDHRFRDSDMIFFRYNEDRQTVFTPVGELASTTDRSIGRNYGGGWLHTFTPTLILDVRAGYAARPDQSAVLQAPTVGLNPMKQAGFGGIDQYQGMLFRLAAPWDNVDNNDIGARGPAPRRNPNWSLTPNISWLKGNHNIKAGAWFIDAKREQLNTFQQFFFQNTQTQGPNNTGYSLASALMGFPNNFQAQLPILHGGPVRFKYAAWAGYLQDEWKVKPRFSLSVGLRLDQLTQPQTTDGRLWNALDLFHQHWIIGAKTLPPDCNTVQQPPCIPHTFFSDPHFNNVVLAGKKFFAPPPVHDNWGPRVGVAWSLTPNTVLRAGYGLYWDAIIARSQYAQNDLEMAVWPDATAFAGTVNSTTTPPSQLVTVKQLNGNFPTPLPTPDPWTPANTFADDPHIKDGYSQQYNLEVQRQLSVNTMVSAAYVGSKNGRLAYTGLANAAPHASPPGTPNAAVDALKPMPWVSSLLRYTQSKGYSNYNALEVKFQRRFSGGLQSLVAYTYGKSIDVSSGYFNVENGTGGSATVQNYFDQRTARGVSGYDLTHFLSWATNYELPFGRGKRWLPSGPLSWVLGNWQANYILQARSGQPYTVDVGGDPAHIGGSTGGFPPSPYARPNLIADPFKAGPVASNSDPGCQTTRSQGGKAADAVHTVTNWFNPCAFAVPVGAFGDVGRTAYRGQHVFNMDFSMFKIFPIRESWDIQLRFEAFNVFNVQNYDSPSTSAVQIGSATATGGTITGTAGQITSLAQGTNARELQFGLRIDF